jgi:hypothetical protein
LDSHPAGALVAGHKKDVVVSAKLANAPGKVAIYGWHKTIGEPIQPLYLGHTATWVDYSQCIRLVDQNMVVNGKMRTVAEVLGDHAVAGLLSDEGPIANPRYPTTIRQLGSTCVNNEFQERLTYYELEPEVKVLVNEPVAQSIGSGKPLLLIFYALPNGNTIEQTVGKIPQPGEDWHFDIQHIGAQTRFLRERLRDQVVVVVYLENALKSWPSWRKKYGDQGIPYLLNAVKAPFADREVSIVLSGHSGGGSLIFGYLNAVKTIPNDIVRISFLDSNYAYDRALGHNEKIAAWLKASSSHFLCVLAYDDATALLDGKPFVTAGGGTWGRSHAMQRDLAETIPFTTRTNAGFEHYTALNGRAQFILKENPERKVLHTIQVERNGFIHSMLTGTDEENKGYEYFGTRAYSKWIQTR